MTSWQRGLDAIKQDKNLLILYTAPPTTPVCTEKKYLVNHNLWILRQGDNCDDGITNGPQWMADKITWS